jgi:putative zinc finger/helix-turn-helix YgiT family protein
MRIELKEGRARKMNCPNDHGEMKIVASMEAVTFRGREFRVEMEHYVCSECGITVDDLALASKNQKALSDAYRRAMNLLTGDEIVAERGKRKWTQEDLARAINVGIASIKRWENGQIQNRAMDDALRRAFDGDRLSCNPYTGNRRLSWLYKAFS